MTSGIPGQRAEDQAGAVVVVSDGTTLRGDFAADSLALLLDDDAAGIQARAGVRTSAMALRGDDDLLAEVLGLPGDTGAVFLTHTDPGRSRAVQQRVREAGGPPVLTDADTVAITLTAALLTRLARAHREPGTSQVVIAGSEALPELTPLLIATGIGDLSSWNTADAHVFPLHHLAQHATVVIDLLGATPTDWPNVISQDDPAYRLLPAPGLCAALTHHPNAPLDIDVFRACALALSAATPSGRPVPDLDDGELTGAITAPVLRVLARRPVRAPKPPHTTS